MGRSLSLIASNGFHIAEQGAEFAVVDLDAIIEIQGTAEGEAVHRNVIDAMVDLALKGIADLTTMQKATLQAAGVELGELLQEKKK